MQFPQPQNVEYEYIEYPEQDPSSWAVDSQAVDYLPTARRDSGNNVFHQKKVCTKPIHIRSRHRRQTLTLFCPWSGV